MPFYQTSSSSSLTMPNSTNSKRQFTTSILLLSMVWTMLFTEAMARPNLQSLWARQNDGSQLLLDELLANANGESLFHELKKYHQKQPNYLAKWPGLRDLVLSIDYDDDTTTAMENNEVLNYKFLERLRQLGASTDDVFEDVVRDDNDDTSASNPMKTSDSQSNQITFKEHNTKKNVQYMSPCHFKICNMGRKRNARNLAKNY